MSDLGQVHLSAGQCWVQSSQSTFLPITLPNVDSFYKFFQRKLSSTFVTEYLSKVPLNFKHGATLPCDLSLITIYVSVLMVL